MPFVAIPDVCSLDVIWSQEGQIVENTFHYHNPAGWDLATLEGVCNTYITWASASSGLFTDVCQFVKCYARDLTSISGASVEVNPPSAINGTDASGQLPNNATWALKRLTGLAGRANRGRIYMIGLPKGKLSADQQSVLPLQATNFRTLYDGLLSAQLSDNAAAEVIAHKALGTSTPVINYGYSDLFLDSQRRRLIGHNIHH